MARIEIRQTIIIDSRQLLELLLQGGYETTEDEIVHRIDGKEQTINLIEEPNPVMLQAMMAGLKSVTINRVSESPFSFEPKETK